MGDIITEAIAIDPSLSSSEVEEHLAFDCRTIKGLTQFLDLRGEEVDKPDSVTLRKDSGGWQWRLYGVIPVSYSYQFEHFKLVLGIL